MKKINIFGHILFWGTMISPVIAFTFAAVIGEVDIFGIAGIVRNSWVMHFFIPIGIMSIVIGSCLMIMGYSYKKNFIIAFICIPLLFILGSFRFIFDNIHYEPQKVIILEEKTALDLPEKVKIATMDFENYNISYVKITNREEKSAFEENITNNDKWSTEVKATLIRSMPIELWTEMPDGKGEFDYFVFYNVDTKQYNNFTESGKYDCVFIAYDEDLSRMIILDEYIIDFT